MVQPGRSNLDGCAPPGRYAPGKQLGTQVTDTSYGDEPCHHLEAQYAAQPAAADSERARAW